MRCSKGLDMKWSLYMSSNQQNLTIGSIRLKSDYRVVKISLTTVLGSYPANLHPLRRGLEVAVGVGDHGRRSLRRSIRVTVGGKRVGARG